MTGDAGQSPVATRNHGPMSPGSDSLPGDSKCDMFLGEDGAGQMAQFPDTECTSVKDPVPYAAPLTLPS